MPRRIAWGLVVAGFVAAVAPAAYAAPVVHVPAASSSSQEAWWYTGLGVPEAQADGWTGAGVKVAVIDEFINPDLPVFDGANLTVDKTPLCTGGTVITHAPNPTNEMVHGSDMVALLVGNGKGPGHVRGIAPKAEVTFYGFGYTLKSDDGSRCTTAARTADVVTRGIQRAMDDGAQVISISYGGGGGTPADAKIIAAALAKGIVITAAVPNTAGASGNGAWPWKYNGVVAVNAFGRDGLLQSDAQTPGVRDEQPGTTVVAPGVGFQTVTWGRGGYQLGGSSLATPLTAGVVALAAQKYPHASGNQLIQSLIRNTTPKDHPLTYSKDLGYGPVSLRHMLREYPAQYKDENPLMDKAMNTPTLAQVAVAKAPRESKMPTASPAAAGSSSTSRFVGPLIVTGIVLVAVVVVGMIVLLILRAARRKKNTGGTA
jgi:hypothetical protein